MIDDDTALLMDVRLALRGLVHAAEGQSSSVRRIGAQGSRHLKLCGWRFTECCLKVEREEVMVIGRRMTRMRRPSPRTKQRNGKVGLDQVVHRILLSLLPERLIIRHARDVAGFLRCQRPSEHSICTDEWQSG
jgi:hypothetical protein